MNILLAAEGARLDAGGVGLVAVPQIARTLAARGHHIALEMFGPPIPGSEEFTSESDQTAFANNLAGFTYPASGRYAFSLRGLTRVVKHVARADFVMLHSLYSFAVLTGYLAARRHSIKYGVWPHGVLAPFQRAVNAQKKDIYDRLASRAILEQASVLFFNAPGERDEAASLNLSAPSVIISHGLELGPFKRMPPRGTFRAKWMGAFEGPVLLYLGRLNAKKGLDLLIQTMRITHAAMPNVRLAIVGVGDPPEFGEQVHSWVREAGLTEVVVMPGLLIGEEKMEALADADIFVLPSVAENFSFAMFEAMAARLPVVISDTLNFATQVVRVGAGQAVPREPKAFAHALTELLAVPEVRRVQGERGAQLAARFSWSEVGAQMEQAILAIVRNQPLPRELVLGQTLIP